MAQDLSGLRYSQNEPGLRSCGLRAALDVVAGKWKPLILWHLLEQPRRFGELRRGVGGVSEKVLTEQLDQLMGAAVISRTLVSEQPLQVEYALTDLGASLAPALAALSAWGFEKIVDPLGDPTPAARPSALR